MSWETEKPEGKTDEPKPEVKVDAPQAEPASVQATEAPEAAASVTEEPKLVPQELIGKVAKKIREKSRGEIADLKARAALLEQENARLKAGSTDWTPEPKSAEPDISQAARKAAREEFLRQQDAYGRKKYGDAYVDALELIKAQNDPVLVAKVQGAADPADTLIAEAVRIAEEIELGPDPVTREQKKQAALKAKWRSEWEAEFAGKLAARGNQPTDVSQVRAAGGNEHPKYIPDTWANSLPR